MTDRIPSEFPDLDTMTPAEFEQFLPDFFAASSNGRVSSDPRFQKFLEKNPDCAALVRDLETIAEHARSLFPQEMEEPSEHVWDRIANEMGVAGGLTPETDPE